MRAANLVVLKAVSLVECWAVHWVAPMVDYLVVQWAVLSAGNWVDC